METLEINSKTLEEFMEYESNDFISYVDVIFYTFVYVTLMIVYSLWMFAMAIKIKKRRRNIRQLKANVLTSGEEEERQKWNLYNEKTHLVKESYLLAICTCEFCFTFLESSVQIYVTLRMHLKNFLKLICPPEYV